MKILIVEDEIKLANAIKRAMELRKYTADIAHNGSDGYDLALTEDYDLIILDIMLPGIDGISLCSKLRKNGVHTPVLMLTAKGQIADKITGLDAGADDYVVKPFSFEELFARIRALTRRPKHTQNQIIHVKDLTLDPQAFNAKRAGKTITLSAKEFALLEYLIRNKNLVLTKEQIMAHVWSFNSDVLPNTVEVHIKHLRDKIDRQFNNPLIKTVRGRGYMVID